MPFRLGTLLSAFVLVLFGVALRGGPVQDQPLVAANPRGTAGKSVRAAASLRVEIKLILISASVTDAMDRPVNTLPQESFRVLEDGIEQKITSFSQEEGPVSMGLAVDTSGSMKNRMDASVEALDQLFQTTIPGDEFFLVQFSDRVRVLTGFTPEPDVIRRKLGGVQAQGWTALLDAVVLSANRMKYASNRRRVLLVLSDGNDNNSRFSEREVRNRVVEGDFRVYGIGLQHKPRLLQQLAEETGGNVLVAQRMNEMPDVVARLSREIRTQYLLGYSSTNPTNDGKYHKVKVELVSQPGMPPLRVSWRRGYYAPGD